jgi:hypothetical protein
VGWWPFNGNADDKSGNGNDGEVNGATLTEDRNSNENSAFTFDGVDDRISLGNTMQNLGASYNPVSISLWFKTSIGYINGFNNSNGTFISDYKRDGVCCENAFLASIKINSTPTRISYSCGESSNNYI